MVFVITVAYRSQSGLPRKEFHIMNLSYAVYLNRLKGLLEPRFVAQSPSLLESSKKDFEYCSRRFSSEGIRFLTVELPSLRKAVDLSFKTGQFATPPSFKVAKGRAYPAFLSSHFERIYNDDGTFRPKPFIPAIRHVRQVLEAFYKLAVPLPKGLMDQALDRFVDNEVYVRMRLNDDNRNTPSGRQLSSGAAMLARYVFKHFDHMDIIPRHGPGSLATREVGEEKWEKIISDPTIYEPLYEVYPYHKYLYVGEGILNDHWKDLVRAKRCQNGTSRVTLVPKDSRGPRIITMEPLEYMWFQQGLGRKMMAWLDNHSLTRGHFNFFDQGVNRELARKSSLSGEFATLDLKDASDLVSVDLVSDIFRLRPSLLKALLALRTPETVLPNGRVVPLKKYAGMGSALCFPVESFVFWSLCVSAIHLESGIGLKAATQLVYTFGDDIIVPTEYAQLVIDSLHSVGLKVNVDKSYFTGSFRESCGMDAYLSIDITPVKFKKPFPVDSDDGTAFAAWCDYANNLASRGYQKLADQIFLDLEKLFGRVPFGVATSSYPCRIVSDPGEAENLNRAQKIRYRFSSRYHREEFRVLTLVPVDKDTELHDWARWLRDIISGTGDDPSKTVDARNVKIVRVWSPV